MRQLILIQLLFAVCAAPCFADNRDIREPRGTDSATPSGAHQGMVEDDDGNLARNEFEVISPNGSITRAFCPYTCEMRGIPRNRCKTWSSRREPDKCYVQDTAIPSGAVELSSLR